MVKRRSCNRLLSGFIAFCLVFVFMVGNSNIAKAQEESGAIGEMVLREYRDVILSRDAEAFDISFADPNKKDLFMSFLKWRTAMMDILDVAYSTYEYEIIDVTAEENGGVQSLAVCFNETHQYSNGAGDGARYDLVMHVEAETSSDGIKLQDISFENDDLYNYFMEQMLMPTAQDAEAADIISNETDRMIMELHDLKAEMDSVYLEQGNNHRETADNGEISPYSTNYSYSGVVGASYAKKYAAQRNTYFYEANGGDCTNFVSQCIWAAYGGWSSSMSNSTMQSNIKNKVRMTSTWYAGSGGGSPAWENVDHLWDYAVDNSGNGPKARGYNDGGYYTNILPIDIAVGDVLQRSTDGSDYDHSMYVVSTPGGSDPQYSEIIIAQHSSENSIISLTERITSDYRYFRQMQFVKNTFDS